MKLFILCLAVFGYLAVPQATAQPRNTAFYGEVLGTTGTYSVGLDQRVAELGTAQLRARIGGSYVQYDIYLDAPEETQILSIPASAVLHVPVGAAAGAGLAVEAEYGASFVRWWGPVDRFQTTVGESFRLFPHASLALRADLGSGRVFARGGLTMGGVRGSTTDVAPTFGVGVGL